MHQNVDKLTCFKGIHDAAFQTERIIYTPTFLSTSFTKFILQIKLYSVLSSVFLQW